MVIYFSIAISKRFDKLDKRFNRIEEYITNHENNLRKYRADINKRLERIEEIIHDIYANKQNKDSISE